jgi:hypothetical protein
MKLGRNDISHRFGAAAAEDVDKRMIGGGSYLVEDGEVVPSSSFSSLKTSAPAASSCTFCF